MTESSPLDRVFGKVLDLDPGKPDALKSILDDVFGASEQQVETFADVMKKEGIITDPNEPGFSRVASDLPDQVAAPDLVDQQSGWIRIQSGWHGDDYVWHFSAWHPKKQFRVSEEKLLYCIARVMNEVIPNTISVKIWLPHDEWDIKEYTFKAMELRNVWSMTDAVLTKINEQLFAVLNALT